MEWSLGLLGNEKGVSRKEVSSAAGLVGLERAKFSLLSSAIQGAVTNNDITASKTKSIANQYNIYPIVHRVNVILLIYNDPHQDSLSFLPFPMLT